jgi:peptide deformylase
MAVLSIIETPDPRLRQISQPVEQVDDALRALMDDMVETMYAAAGIGLAAIQVGIPKRVLVMDLQEDDGSGERVRKPLYFVNPEIIGASDELSVFNEGCLSVPEMYADVVRPAAVRARWLDYDGVAHEEDLNEMMATCLQHEMDHLNGVLFIDHLSKLKRDMLLKRLEKIRKSEKIEAA